jgi:hypothetical protein
VAVHILVEHVLKSVSCVKLVHLLQHGVIHH